MSLGAVLEPLLVVGLLGTGVWLNRVPEARVFGKDDSKETTVVEWVPLLDEEGQRLLDEDTAPIPSHRQHQLRLGHLIRTVQTPNTAVHKNRLCSRVLRKFPFLVEVWYWALIYWVYAIGRPITALTLRDGTVDVARKHALTLVKLEQQLHFFEEARIQHFFLQYPSLMRWIGWLYSFVHIPGSIAFLIFLYWYINTRNRLPHAPEAPLEDKHDSPTGPELYEARRRTMAACNLLSFIVFTAWPCMPPRLLSDPNVPGEVGDLARSFGFVDTVHGANIGSVWTHHRFSHQYAAMPSLHFGYALMIGLTIMMLPLAPEHAAPLALHVAGSPVHMHLPSRQRLLCILVGVLYPFVILVAIVSTANHFLLDAVAGAIMCALGWKVNALPLNLLPLEDYFLSCLRVHKPTH